MSVAKLDIEYPDTEDIDADDPVDMAEPDWEQDPDDQKYIPINSERQKCPSCLRLENNEIRRSNIIIRKENVARRVSHEPCLSEIKPLNSVTTTFLVSKVEGGWTRYRCKKCGFVHMYKYRV
jgi:hypothetical protein